MAKGGYQVIDFGGAVLGTSPRTFKDAYKKVSTGKAILIEDVKFDLDMPTVSGFGVGVPTADDYTITIIVYGTLGIQAVTITITDEDAVTAEFTTLAEAE